MATKVARGKALVAKLRANPKTRDAEALAAWIGRKHGKPKRGGSGKKKSLLADILAEDDEFKNEAKSKEEEKQERYERRLIRQREKEERSRFFGAIMDMGGIKSHRDKDLREEYQGIPNTYKRKDGMSGDEMAEYLGMYYPEFGIESERDLIDYFSDRAA